jgi:hypothetical protein
MLKRLMGGRSPSNSRLNSGSIASESSTGGGGSILPPGSPKIKDSNKTLSDAALTKASSRLRSPTLPPNPNPKTVQVRMGNGEMAPTSVSETIDMFITTWNMSSCSIPEAADLDTWLPSTTSNFDFYAIAIQDCKNVKTLQKNILEYLGGEENIHAFKYKELGSGSLSLLLFAKQSIVKAGVLFPTRLNDCVKCEVKSKGIISNSGTGRGGILMQMIFHNTTIAFLAVRLDDTITEGALDRRIGDLEQVFRQSGIVPSDDRNDLGIPVLEKVQHIFLLGDFGTRCSKHVPETLFQGARPNMWSASAWDKLRRLDEDEFETLALKVKQIQQFDELNCPYPPTSRRMVKESFTTTTTKSNQQQKKSPASSPRAASSNAAAGGGFQDQQQVLMREPSPSICELFETTYDIAHLYDSKLFKKEGLPSFQDRILFRTLQEYTSLLTEGDAGSAEMMRLSSHVPVYTCFRINGVDPLLLKRWQIITGNMPVTSASRTDERLVGGVVENLLSELDAATAARLEQERQLQALIESMKKCNRCKLPLSLEGGDIDMGDEHGAFHRKCFSCYECGKDLLGEKLMHVDDRWLCLESYDLLYRPNCPICKKATDTAVVMGRKKTRVHPHCLECVECKKSLFDFNKKTVLPMNDLDSQPYCLDDYEKLKKNFCVACRRPFTNELFRAEIPFDNFHSECFGCSDCGRDFHDDPVKIAIRQYQAFCAETHLPVRQVKSVRLPPPPLQIPPPPPPSSSSSTKRESHAVLPPPPPPMEDDFGMPPPPPLDEALPPPPAPPKTTLTRKSIVPGQLSPLSGNIHGPLFVGATASSSSGLPPPPPTNNNDDNDNDDNEPPPPDDDHLALPPPPPYNDKDLDSDDDD